MTSQIIFLDMCAIKLLKTEVDNFSFSNLPLMDLQWVLQKWILEQVDLPGEADSIIFT